MAKKKTDLVEEKNRGGIWMSPKKGENKRKKYYWSGMIWSGDVKKMKLYGSKKAMDRDVKFFKKEYGEFSKIGTQYPNMLIDIFSI